MVEAENPLIIPSNEIIQPVEIAAVGEEKKESIVTDKLHVRNQIVWDDLVELGHLVKANQMTVDGDMGSERGQLEITEELAEILFDSSENHLIFCHYWASRVLLVLEVVVFLLEAIEHRVVVIWEIVPGSIDWLIRSIATCTELTKRCLRKIRRWRLSHEIAVDRLLVEAIEVITMLLGSPLYPLYIPQP